MDSQYSRISQLLGRVEEKIFSGNQIDRKEAEALIDLPDQYLMKLLSTADMIRKHFKGEKFDSCSLINAKSGLCSEDCSFCAQSARYNTGCETFQLRSTEEILNAANEAKKAGADRFCAVTSGGSLSSDEFDSLMESLSKVRSEVDINLDASLGFLDDSRARSLREVGVTRYNHNLETSREHYPNICSTHTYDERLETVKKTMEQGFSACCGGIIGLGETLEQRLDLAFTLAEMQVDCVPINILNPRPGTPLEDSTPIPPMEILRTLAVFRLILPKATIKIAGGRELNLGDFQGMALRSGANGMIIGGYLTTGGRKLEDDLRMIREAGYSI